MTTTLRSSLLYLIVTALLVSGLSAQVPADSGSEQANNAMADVMREVRSRRLGEPALQSQPVSEESAVVIEAGEEKQTAKLRFTFAAANKPNTKNIVALTISSPIGKDEASADLLGQDGLAGTLSAEFSYTWIDWPAKWERKLSDQQLHEAKLWLCYEVKKPAEASSRDKLRSELENYLKPENRRRSTEELKAAYPDAVKLEGDCTEEVFTEEWKAGDPDALLAWKKATRVARAVPMLGGSLKAGRETFEFAEAVGLTPKEETRTGQSVNAAFGLLLPRLSNRASSLWLTATTERTYKAKDAVNICVPSTTGSSLTCEEKVIGEPERTENEVFSLEYRHFMRKMALSPRVFRRPEAGVTGVDVPVYFLMDNAESRNFTGGIRISWRSDTDDVTAGVFVGAALPTLGALFGE